MEPLDFLERARASFLRLAAADPDHYLVIDARLAVDEIAEQVLGAVRPLLGQAKRA
jgi:dTMP kinase